MLKQLLHHLDPTGELKGACLRIKQIREHQGVDSPVSFLGFVIHLGFLFTTGLLDRRVENVLLQSGVDLQFLPNALQQFGALLHGTLCGRAELFQQFLDQLMVLNQQIDSIHGVTSSRANEKWLA
ncbi:hypothetical protein D3C78_1441570 [compost metagenome]